MQIVKLQIPEDLYYDSNDYWLKVAGKEAVIGISEYGQNNMGDILYLEMVVAGTVIRRGEKIGSLESGKWVGNLIAPISGVVLEINSQVELDPGQVNDDAYGCGWILKVELDDPGELQYLMNATAYKAYIDEQMRLEREEGMS